MEQLREIFGTGTTYHFVLAFAQFFVAVLAGWIFRFFLTTAGRRITAKTANSLDDRILTIAIEKVIWVASVFGAYLAVRQLTLAVDPNNTTAVQLLGYGQGIIFVSFVLVLAIILIRITDTSIKHAIEMHSVRTSSRFNEALLPLINRIINIIIGLIGVIIILDHFGQNVSSLVVSLGVGSLAIALAAQDTIANMIGGFIIMLDRPFRVGDRIQLPSGDIGDVYEIGIRSTKILNFDNNLIISPNAELIKGKVVNYSYPVEIVRLIIEVGVAYGTDTDRARAIMIREARKHPLVLEDPAPEVFLKDLADSSVNLRLVARTADFRHKFATEAAIREHVYNAFNQEGVEIPFPQRVVHMKSTSHAKPKNTSKRKASRR